MAAEKHLTELAAETADELAELNPATLLAARFRGVISDFERAVEGHPGRAAVGASLIRAALPEMRMLLAEFDYKSAARRLGTLDHALRAAAGTRAADEERPRDQVNKEFAGAARASGWSPLEADLLLSLLELNERISAVDARGATTNRRHLSRLNIRDLGRPASFTNRAEWSKQFPALPD
jgi:hypothetical protein